MEWGCHQRDLSHDQRGSEPGTALLGTSPPMASSPMASLAPADPLRPRRHGTCRPAADTMNPSPVGLGGFRPPPDSVPCPTNTNQTNGWARHHCYYGSSSDYDHYHYYPAAPAALPHTCLGPHRLGAHGLRPVHQSLARGSRPPCTWARTAVTTITATSSRPGTC